MTDVFSKSKNRSAIFIILLIIFFLLIHSPLIKRYISTDGYNGKSFEDRSIAVGDFTYYLHGALSIFDFEIDKKFNDKQYPIMGQQRRIVETDMPWYAKYVLVFYPNPSFKFGYSLTAALITAPFPDKLFHYHIHRLVFVNIILIILSLALIFLIVKKITDNEIPAVIACLFFIFDVSNAYNSYGYQSHTMSGIFYLFLGYYIFVRSESITPLRLGIIAFLMVFAVFSSSHIIPLAFLMGLFIYLQTCYRENKTKKILKYTVAGIAGASILPLYILGGEKLFKFKKLGLPDTFAQLKQYRSTVNDLISTYPVHLRFMWDIRLFNVFIVPILAITLFIFFYHRYTTKTRTGMLSFSARIRDSITSNRKYYTLFFSIVFSTLVVAFYTQPVSRGMTPYTILWGIVLGIFLGKRFASGNNLIKICIGIIPLMLFLNFYLMSNIISLPDNRPSNNILVINENEIVWKNLAIYFKDPTSSMHDYYDYKMISKSIKEFIEIYDSGLSDKENAYIQFDAMDLVLTYTPTRRFTPKFVPNRKDVVSQRTFFKDFRLLMEIFALHQKGLLNDSDIIRKEKMVWNFITWDQEYNYIYGYFDYVKKFLKGTPLEQLSPRYVYYINYGALKGAIAKEQSKEVLVDLEKARVESGIVFSNAILSNGNWADHQSPEVNELATGIDGRNNCRHVVDSTPSFGGIINANNFPLDKRKDYEVEFKIKVISGTVNMQVIMDYGSIKPEYASFGGITDGDWTVKTTYFNSNKIHLINKINFTNNSAYDPAEFYLCDVHIRSADYID